MALKKDLSIWEKYSLIKINKICNISLPTVFTWKHKILETLQETQENVKLNGVVEFDKTFLPISYKSYHNVFNPHISKKMGTEDFKSRLSKELVCMLCIVNLNGKSVANIANLVNPNVKALNGEINDNIKKDSIFATDILRNYLKLSNKMELNCIKIPYNKHYNNYFNIQVVISCRSILKAMLIYACKGFLVKYLNNYLVYYNFVNFAKKSKKNKKLILLNHIANANCINKNVSKLVDL